MKFVDLDAQYRSIRKEIDQAILEVIRSGQFILGKEVEGLEEKIAKFCGCKYAVAVNSGTDALFLSLKALGIKRGDEVITTPFTFVATGEVIGNLGARPIFVDINPATFNINPDKIEAEITKRTKAIIPVHLFGQMADMAGIMRVAKKYKLKVIEDAAQAIGAVYKGKKAGKIGDCGCFSFFPTKNLGAYGDGGMIVTNNKRLADNLRLLRSHGSSPKEKYLNLALGMNSRLDAVQAAVLRVKLKYLEGWSRRRGEKARYYNKFLRGVGGTVIPEVRKDRTHIFHQYTIRAKKRDALRKFLKKAGIPTMAYYFLPLHLQPVFKYLSYKKGDLPEAEKAAEEVLNLPCYPELKRSEQDLIIKKVKEFYA